MSLCGSTETAWLHSATESCQTAICLIVSPPKTMMMVAAAPITKFPTRGDSLPLRRARRHHATPAPPRIAHGAHARYVYRSAAICAPLWRTPTTGARRTMYDAHAVKPAGHRRYPSTAPSVTRTTTAAGTTYVEVHGITG